MGKSPIVLTERLKKLRDDVRELVCDNEMYYDAQDILQEFNEIIGYTQGAYDEVVERILRLESRSFE